MIHGSHESRYQVLARTAEQGLPHNWLKGIRQTRDGYIWVTTGGGLVRFDGARFKVFNQSNTPELTSNRFTFSTLLEDSEGALWMGTLNGGAIRYFNGAFTAITTAQGLPNNRVVRIDEAEDGTRRARYERYHGFRWSAQPPAATPIHREGSAMSTVTTKDGTSIFYKDWGPRDGQPIVFHHGWPLSADDWDAQMLFFLAHGYRVIAHDRRGHGRSSQTATGHEMDTYAADVAALTDALDLKGACHVGHSTGGGEVAHYVARAKPGRVAKAVLVGAVPPVMVKSATNPGGLPIDVFDGLRTALVANRAQFYLDLPSGPFYGFNRPGAKVSQGLIDNWWRQGMIGAANAHYECIKAFSETDFTEDLKKIDVPVLVAHGTDDQIVPYADSAPLSVKLLKHGTLKSYEGLPHGMLSTHPEILNPDILAFLKA